MNAGLFAQTEKYHRGSYLNQEYGYSIVIVKGLIGTGDPAPSPHHGLQIALMTEPKFYIWVDGSYNAALWTNLDEAVNTHMEWLKQESAEVTLLIKNTMPLNKLKAVRCVIRYKPSSTNQVMIQDLILTLRQRKKVESIFYTVGLRTSETHYTTDKKVFEKIINSWKLEPLPR